MADAFNTAIAGSSSGWTGWTLVMVFNAAALADVNGTQVRLTVEFNSASPPNANTFAAVYMGKAAGSGDIYDFAATPAHVTFSGGDIVGDNSTFIFVSDTVDLPEAFDGTVNYCVAVEFTTNLVGNADIQFASSVSNVTAAYSNVLQAATVNKSSGYSTESSVLYFVSRIEILGATAHQGDARFGGAGALSIAAKQAFNASVLCTGAGALSAQGNLQARAAAQFSGVGSFAARANMPQPAFATFSGLGALSVQSQIGQLAAATFSGLGALSAQPQIGQLAAATFEGLGTLSAEATLAQFLRPDADDLDGSWTNELDGTNLFPSIDEAIVPDDADYIKSDNHPVADICRFGISNPTRTPAGPMRLRVRYRREGTGVVNLVVRLKQDTTEIAAWTYNDIGASFVTAEETLTGPQFAAITNFNNLFVELQADEA